MLGGVTTKDRLAIRNRFYEKGWHFFENVRAVLFRNITLWLTFFHLRHLGRATVYVKAHVR